MIRANFEFVPGGEAGRFVYTPSASINFDPIDIEIPKVKGFLTRPRFAEVLEVKVQLSCGLGNLCVGSALVNSADLSMSADSPITKASIWCSRGNCPLSMPPAEGDSEPLVPIGPTPTLSATVETPCD